MESHLASVPILTNVFGVLLVRASENARSVITDERKFI